MHITIWELPVNCEPPPPLLSCGEPFQPEKVRSKEGYGRLAEDMMKRVYALKERI